MNLSIFTLTFFLSALLGQNLIAAESIKCFKDYHQSEGPIITLLLKKNSQNKYNLTETTKFVSGENPEKKTKLNLVEGLECSLQGITGECHKNQKIDKGIFRYSLVLSLIKKTTTQPERLKVELTASNQDKARYLQQFEVNGSNERCSRVN